MTQKNVVNISLRNINKTMLSPKKLIAFGNVLLDMSIKTNDNYILHKHKLKEDDQCEVPAKNLLEIIKDATERYGKAQLSAGGSALNTCRILKSLGENSLLFFGAIGNDEHGELLRGILESQQLDQYLQVLDNHQTGACVCLIDGVNRCLCANIGASLHFQQKHLENIDEIYNFGNKSQSVSQIFYIEGYFIPNKFAICEHIYETYCKNSSNILAINVNAAYICEEYPEKIKWLVTEGDLIFCNYWELSALTATCDFKSNEATIEYFFSQYNKKGKIKFFVVTKGSENVQVYFGNALKRTHQTFATKLIPINMIVDTTGAGDSFVAGFLFAFFHNKTLKECVDFGCDTAGRVITQIGCKLSPPVLPSVEDV